MIRLSAAQAKRVAVRPAQPKQPRRGRSATPDRTDLLAACASRGWVLRSWNGGRWRYVHRDGHTEETDDYLALMYRCSGRTRRDA